MGVTDLLRLGDLDLDLIFLRLFGDRDLLLDKERDIDLLPPLGDLDLDLRLVLVLGDFERLIGDLDLDLRCLVDGDSDAFLPLAGLGDLLPRRNIGERDFAILSTFSAIGDFPINSPFPS